MKKHAPCKDCPRRAPACSSECDDYKAFKTDVDARKEYLRMKPVDLFTYAESMKNKMKNKRR